jgi:hypothetical protein
MAAKPRHQSRAIGEETVPMLTAGRPRLLTDQHRMVFATSPQTLTVVPGSSGSNCELCGVAEDLGPYVFGVILALFG